MADGGKGAGKEARGGQALLLPHGHHAGNTGLTSLGRRGVSILHTLNTSAGGTVIVWRGSHQVTRQGRQVKIRAGRGLRAQEGQTGR